jgi:hypothetical protein
MMPRTRADAVAIASLALLIAAVVTTNLMQQRAAAPAPESIRVEPAIIRAEPTIEPEIPAEPAIIRAEPAIAPEAPVQAALPITAWLGLETPEAIPEHEPSGILARYQKSLIKPAHDRVVMQYMPPMLRSVLDRASKYFAAPVLVTSAYRSPSYNRQVRGVRNSMHMVRDGKRGAVDFKVVGVPKTVLYAWAKRQPEVHGIGLYCRSDFIHVDNGSKRSWYWGCGGGRTRHAKRSRQIQVAGAVAPSTDH